jgi:hypothetical protein
MLVLGMPASAQPKIALPAPKKGTLDTLIPVMAQSARVMAVSDTHSMLAFGHDKDADVQVSLVKLDPKGTPAASSAQLKLPIPVELTKLKDRKRNYVTGVAFHPKLPLLYVWQDVDVYYSNPVPPGPPETMQFEHLCIVSFAKDPPELVVSLCRGLEYTHGQGGGAVAVDPTGSFLYVPNLRELKNAGSFRIGRYPLDADGLPFVNEKDTKDPLPARIKKLTEASNTEKFTPPQLTPIEYLHLFNHSQYGCAHSLWPLSKDVVLVGINNGLMTWRPEEKHVIAAGVPLQRAGHTQFAAHPALPAIFATVQHGPNDTFFRAEQSEGYLTLLPKQYEIKGSKLTGQPAIMPKAKKVLIGGESCVYAIDLDDKGFPTGEPVQIVVNCPQVKAMVYSEKYERAYVGVEVSK